MKPLQYIHDLIVSEENSYTKTKDYKRYDIVYTDGTEDTIYANGKTNYRGRLHKFYRYKEDPYRVKGNGQPSLSRTYFKEISDIRSIEPTIVGQDTWIVERWDHAREQSVTANLTEPRNVQ